MADVEVTATLRIPVVFEGKDAQPATTHLPFVRDTLVKLTDDPFPTLTDDAELLPVMPVSATFPYWFVPLTIPELVTWNPGI